MVSDQSSENQELISVHWWVAFQQYLTSDICSCLSKQANHRQFHRTADNTDDLLQGIHTETLRCDIHGPLNKLLHLSAQYYIIITKQPV